MHAPACSADSCSRRRSRQVGAGIGAPVADGRRRCAAAIRREKHQPEFRASHCILGAVRQVQRDRDGSVGVEASKSPGTSGTRAWSFRHAVGALDEERRVQPTACSSVKPSELHALGQAGRLAGAAALADARVHVGGVAADMVPSPVADLASPRWRRRGRPARRQAADAGLLVRPRATTGSRSISSWLKRASTLAAGGARLATVSGMSSALAGAGDDRRRRCWSRPAAAWGAPRRGSRTGRR